MLCPLVWRCPKKKMTNFVPKNSHDNNNNSFAFQDLQSKEKKWSTSPSPPSPPPLLPDRKKKLPFARVLFFAFSRATARRGGRYLWYREKICAPNQYWCWQGELGELSNFCQVVAVAGKATGDSTTNLAMAHDLLVTSFFNLGWQHWLGSYVR